MASNPTKLPSEEELAAANARADFLRSQAAGFITNVRMLKVQLAVATSAGELPDKLREHLYNELLQCAGIVEVKK